MTADLLNHLHADSRRATVRAAHRSNGVATDKANRDLNDWYATPTEAVEALLSVEHFEGPIWECACGDGAISRVLEARGYEVLSTDLVDRGYGTPRVDFLLEQRALAPNIVTNPPFKNTLAFMERALRLAPGKVAFFLRIATLEGQRRGELYRLIRPARIYIFSSRQNVWRRGERTSDAGGVIGFMWLVWHSDRSGPTITDWLP